jgi:hypothetical protein
MLGRLFGPKRNRIIRSWRKVHNEELHNFQSSARMIGGQRRAHGEKINACSIVEGKRVLGNPITTFHREFG